MNNNVTGKRGYRVVPLKGVPRIMVRISKTDIEAATQKTIITDEGEEIQLITRYETTEEARANRWGTSLRFAPVEGISDNCIGIEIGDIAIIDYTVHANAFVEEKDKDDRVVLKPAHNVIVDGPDILVSIPCVTTYHTEEERSENTGSLVAAVGDIDTFGLVFGIIRNNTLYPNPYYIFCEYQEQEYSMLFRSDGETHFAMHDQTHLKRKVVAAHPDSGVAPGQTVLAVYDSNVDLVILGHRFDIIPVSDLLAICE